MDTYKVKLGDESYTLRISDLEEIDLLKTSPDSYHVLKGRASYEVEIINTDFSNKSIEVKINGNLYNMQIEDKLDMLVNEMGFSAASTQKIKYIKAPMPGLVLDILVEAGQEVQEGDPLVILEAMKMENILKADGEGIVKRVEAITSKAVEKGQVLIEME